MDIQATVSSLQSDMKRTSMYISELEEGVKYWLTNAKEAEDVKYYWRQYHRYKESVAEAVAQQKINKSLYKLMCTIQKQMPNGSISMAQIREM